MKSIFGILILLILSLGKGFSQGVPSVDESEPDTLNNIIMNADTISHYTLKDGEVDTLINNVILTQDSLVMYCNRATVLNQTYARAYGEVVIIHHDTIQIFADSMWYDGLLQTAQLFGEVILQDGDRRLYTTELFYNVKDKTAEYLTGGTLIDEIDTIRSKEGFYFQRDKKVKLYGNVSFVDTSRILNTDSILYLYDIDQLNILAPTEILQDDVSIYCEGGLYRLKSDRGVLTDNVQVLSENQLITAGILDIKGAEDTYTFLINPSIRDGEKRAKGDTIVLFDQLGRMELRSNASYISPTEQMFAPMIIYDKKTESYKTRGRAQVITGDNIIEADTISSQNDNVTRLKGKVQIVDIQGDVQIQSDEGLQQKEQTKLFSSRGQALLTYEMKSEPLFLLADTLLSIEPRTPPEKSMAELDSTLIDTSGLTTNVSLSDTLASAVVDSLVDIQDSTDINIKSVDSLHLKNKSNLEEGPSPHKQFEAIRNVKFMNGNTFGASQNFIFNKQDSILIMTNRPILWADSTQLTGDTIKIYLQKNEVHKISLIGNGFIVSPDSSGMYNQIKGLRIDNFLLNKKLSRSYVKGNAELFYMIAEGNTYSGINLTRSNEMIFSFENDDITQIQMEGQPESNMYEYIDGINLEQYYLEGFEWRFEERPNEKYFAKK